MSESPSVPVLEADFQFIGEPAEATITPTDLVTADVSASLGSSQGTDFDYAICVDLGDDVLAPISEFLTTHADERNIYATSALFSSGLDEDISFLFGPCVGNGNFEEGDYNPLDDNDYVWGRYEIADGSAVLASKTVKKLERPRSLGPLEHAGPAWPARHPPVTGRFS